MVPICEQAYKRGIAELEAENAALKKVDYWGQALKCICFNCLESIIGASNIS